MNDVEQIDGADGDRPSGRIPDTPRTLLDELSRQDALDDFRWRQFDELYRPVIAFFIRQRFASLAGDIEDLTQEVMSRLVGFLRERKYRSDTSRFRTVLQAMVHNLCIDFLRHQTHLAELPLMEIDLEELESGDADVASQLDVQWAEACWRAARRHVLRKTPVNPRHAAIYRELEKGVPVKELADRYGLTPEGIRQVRHRMDALITAYARSY